MFPTIQFDDQIFNNNAVYLTNVIITTLNKMPNKHQDFFSKLYEDDAFAYRMTRIYNEILNRYGKFNNLIESGHIDPNAMNSLQILNFEIIPIFAKLVPCCKWTSGFMQNKWISTSYIKKNSFEENSLVKEYDCLFPVYPIPQYLVHECVSKPLTVAESNTKVHLLGTAHLASNAVDTVKNCVQLINKSYNNNNNNNNNNIQKSKRKVINIIASESVLGEFFSKDRLIGTSKMKLIQDWQSWALIATYSERKQKLKNFSLWGIPSQFSCSLICFGILIPISFI
eukprot:Pgem_evm1s11573